MTRSRILPIAVWAICMLLLAGVTYGQGETEEGYKEANILKQKSVLLRSGDDILLSEYDQLPEFPNVNKMPKFYDKKRLAAIRQLEENSETDGLVELDNILIPYINEFAVENFRDDVSLLWLAGGIKHAMRDTLKAIYYYELAKIHNRTPMTRGKWDGGYEEITAPTNTEWLPIDKYYELLEVRKKIDPLIPPRKVLLNMGTQINSDGPDYAPSMHPSDSVLIFTSRRDKSNRRMADFVDPFYHVNEDLYYAIKDFRTGAWMDAIRMPDTINSPFNEGSAVLAPDGKTLYFTRCRNERGFGDCDLYRASYDPAEQTWTHIQNLGGDVNSKAWDSQPNISVDGQTLFFASNRKGGFGGTDIYYTTLDDDGHWTPARNLGPMINSPQHEVTPFFHKINQSLYFSSTGHLKNFGGYDIFKTRWVGDRWEPPKNVGPLVNTKGNEYYFSIDSKGETIFYANSKDPEKDHVKQNFDLYSFPMPMEARPDAMAQIRGFLVDSVSGHTLQGTVMIVDLEDSIEVAPKKINESGYFEFDLINNKRYRIYVLGENFLTVKNDIVLNNDTSFSVLTQSFEQNKPIVFESMEFNSNSAKLKSSVKPKLDYIVEFLKTYPMFKLEVEGHTDSDGREESNLRLSLERASSLSDYITRKGEFEEGRVTAKGYGETRPIVPNDTEENKRKNRRVEFKLALDTEFEGDMWLPTKDELFFDEDRFDDSEDVEFDDEFEWDEGDREGWDEELDLDEDLDAELESDIVEDLEDLDKEGK